MPGVLDLGHKAASFKDARMRNLSYLHDVITTTFKFQNVCHWPIHNKMSSLNSEGASLQFWMLNAAFALIECKSKRSSCGPGTQCYAHTLRSEHRPVRFPPWYRYRVINVTNCKKLDHLPVLPVQTMQSDSWAPMLGSSSSVLRVLFYPSIVLVTFASFIRCSIWAVAGLEHKHAKALYSVNSHVFPFISSILYFFPVA